VEDGPRVPGFGGGCGCPDKGRPVVDPGYFTQMRKQRSVSAVSQRFAVVRAGFLREGEGRGRVIFSPFLRCDAVAAVEAETGPIGSAPDFRYYPRYFGLTPETAYRLRLRE